MRVCFLEDTYLHGGTQIWVSEAIRAFHKQGVEITLLTATDGFNAKNAAELDIKLVTYDFEEIVKKEAKHRAAWADALSDADVAVCTVHPPRDGFHCSVFGAEVIHENNFSTVLLPKTGTIVPEYLREFYAPTQPINSHVISITNFTREYLIDSYGIPADQVSLVYQGTDVQAFTRDAARQTEAQQRYQLPEGAGPVLGNVGSFEERKGQVVLLEAIKQARTQLPDIHLMMVGDGPDEAMLKQKISEWDLQANVTMFPFTKEPVYVFEVIDILVLSSLYKEGLPNVLLESLAMEVPVISSKMAGVPEAVIEGETGYMVTPGDVNELAEAIVKLGSDADLRQKMGQTGCTMMTEKFDKQHQFQAFIDFFEMITRRFIG